MAWGGKRIGAGKPKGYKAPHTLEASVAKQRIIDKVSARIDEIIEKLLELGINQGEVSALKELLDRAYGKAKETMDMNVNMEKPILQNVSRNDSPAKDIKAG